MAQQRNTIRSTFRKLIDLVNRGIDAVITLADETVYWTEEIAAESESIRKEMQAERKALLEEHQAESKS